MAKKLYGNLEIRSQQELRFFEAVAGGTNKVALKAAAAIGSDFALTLPSAQAANDDIMKANSSGELSFGKIVNANVDAAAAIAYSKLSLSNSIVNADINASAAIAYSKLSLADSIVNADINSAAAIAYSKLNLSGSIVNADISASAAIVYSKLSIADGDLTIAKTSGLQAALDGKAALAGAVFTGNIELDNAKEVRFREADGNGDNYVGLKAPASLSGDLTYTLPSSAPAANGYVLAAQTDGTMSWVSNASSASASDTWTTGEGVLNAGLYEFSFTHNLNSNDVFVQIYDTATNKNIEVDDIERTSVNAIKLYASEDANATGWRIMVLKA